jgi:hypothetical protein
LCKFKYFAQSRTLARGGGGRRSDRVVFWASNPHCAVNDSNSKLNSPLRDSLAKKLPRWLYGMLVYGRFFYG